MKNKIIYVLMIIFTIVLYVFFESEVLKILLAYELILIPIMFLTAIFISRGISAKIIIPYFHAQKNSEFPIEVHISNDGILSASSVFVKIKCINEFTGKIYYINDTIMAEKNKISVLEVFLKSEFCGKLKFEIECIRVWDYLHLFSKTVKLNSTDDEIMILPAFHKIFLENEKMINSIYASEEFSHVKSGEDSSEVFDVHMFRPGDTMQRIHWKLTAKTNEYLVKEFSMPLEHMVYIFLDFYCENLESISQVEFDIFLEILASLSYSMSDKKISHMVVWQNGKEVDLKMSFVEYEKDVYNMLEQVCDAKIYDEKKDLETVFMHKYGISSIQNKLKININGCFYNDDILKKQFGNDEIEKELMEWRPEI